MTDFVEDIAGCIPDYGQWTDPDFAEKTASRIKDRIIARIPPLVWEDTSENDGWFYHFTGTSLSGSKYVIKAAGPQDMFVCAHCGYFASLSDAKAAANAHHVAQLCKGMGIE